MKTKIEKQLKNWYLLLITGVLFLVISIWIFFTPKTSFVAIAWMIGCGFILAGISEVLFSLSNKKFIQNWGRSFAGGLITFILGLLLALRPDITAFILSIHIAFLLLFYSILHIINSLELKKLEFEKWGLILVLGILGVIIAFILLLNPVIISVIMSYLLGIGLFILGVIQIVLSLGLLKIKTKIQEYRDRFNG